MKLTNYLPAGFKAWVAQKMGPAAQAFLSGSDASPNNGAMLTAPYAQSVWIYCAIQALSRNLSQIDYAFYRGERDTENILSSGPLVDLFNQPHESLDKYLFFELLVTWLGLRGEAFIVALDSSGGVLPIKRGMRAGLAKGTIDQLIILPPDRFWHIVGENRLEGWQYTASPVMEPLAGQTFLPEEVIQIRTANPYNFWRGFSPVTVARLAAETDFASASFMKGLMMNNADTGLIVTTDQQLSDEQRQQMTAALRERKRKAGTADRPIFLGGGAKIEKPTITSADMQFISNRNLNRKEIGAIYRVPPTIMGFSEDANRAIAGEERVSFIENEITPLARRIEAALNPIVQAMDPGVKGIFRVEGMPIMQQARRERADTAVKYFSIGIPLNDINRELDLGFDYYAWGDVGYLPFGLQTATQAQGGSLDAQSPAAGGSAGSDASAQTSPKQISLSYDEPFSRLATLFRQAQLPAPATREADNITHVCGASDAYVASLSEHIRAKESKLKRIFFEWRGAVLARLNSADITQLKGGSLDALSPGGVTKGQDGIEGLFNVETEGAKLEAALKPFLISDLAFGGAQLFKELGKTNFKLVPLDTIKFLELRQNVIKEIAQTTFDDLKSSLVEGLKAGETMSQLVDRVKATFTTASESRASTIATTETNVAVNTGRFAGMKQAGVEYKSWLASKLPNSREAHQAAGKDYSDGIPIDEPFIVGGEALMFPGDPAGSPGNVINCKCTATAKQKPKGDQ